MYLLDSPACRKQHAATVQAKEDFQGPVQLQHVLVPCHLH